MEVFTSQIKMFLIKWSKQRKQLAPDRFCHKDKTIEVLAPEIGTANQDQEEESCEK